MSTMSWFNHIFRDSNGKIAIIQWPNIPLSGWILFKVAAMISNNSSLIDVFNIFGTVLLLIWASLELTNGTSTFRRILGLVILIFTILNMTSR